MRGIFHSNAKRDRRAKHVRRVIRATTARPRLSVHRSLKHISAQVIDDKEGKTLCFVSTTARTFADDLKGKTKSQKAAFIGAEIARRAKEAGVSEVVFDRGAARYHGRVKALADAAREGGLQF